MRLEMITLHTKSAPQRNSNGFVTSETEVDTTISASELSVRISDTIAGEHEGWTVSVKLAVDIDDYETAIVTPASGRRILPQSLTYNGVEYLIKRPVKNLKTHQMELLCSEVS